MNPTLNILVYTVMAALAGIVFFALAIILVPRFVNRLTPTIDEEKEILKGNVAVAVYFGLLVAAALLGLSVIIGAAIIAGFNG